MLEYSLEDAEKLLTTNMETAQENLNQVEHDLDFLRFIKCFKKIYNHITFTGRSIYAIQLTGYI